MKPRSSLLHLIDLLFLLLLAVYIVAGTALVPFHGDEATQVYMSHDYAYQFLQRDLSLVTYSDPPVSAQEQDLRLLNGTVNQYLIGLAWHLGGFTAADLNEQWDWGGDWTYNQQNNHAPSDALLMASRLPSTLLLVVGLFAMFGLGRQLGGRPVAYLAALFYALHPVLLLNGRRAMMEGSFIAFSLLTVLAAAWFMRPSPPDPLSHASGERGRNPLFSSWLAAMVLGIAAGLALASKHTAVFTVTAVFGACGLWIFVCPSPPAPLPRKRGEGGRSRLLPFAPLASRLLKEKGLGDKGFHVPLRITQLVIAAIFALAVFYVLNPAWWGDPLTRAGQVLERRQELLTEQVTIFGGYADTGDALAGLWRQVFVGLPQYYEVAGWEAYIGDQIARYEASPWHGVTIGGSTVGALILAVLFLIGVWVLLRAKTIPAGVRWLIGVWVLVMFGTTALLTPLEWQRYYIPVYPAIGLLAALGAWWIVQRIWRSRFAVG